MTTLFGLFVVVHVLIFQYMYIQYSVIVTSKVRIIAKPEAVPLR